MAELANKNTLIISYKLPSPNSTVRQVPGRPGEIWGAASGADTLVVIRTQ